MTTATKTLTKAERAQNEKLHKEALPTMKANGAFLLAEIGIENPSSDVRRAAELVAMNLAQRHPMFIGMMMGCTIHEIVNAGEVAQKYCHEGDNRSVREAPGMLHTLVIETAKTLRLPGKKGGRAA